MIELPSYAKPDLWLDSDHALEWLIAEGDSEPYGARFWHRRNTKQYESAPEWCLGTVVWRERLPYATAAQCWQLVSREPFHIEPSVLCSCGEHGFIRDGKWVSC